MNKIEIARELIARCKSDSEKLAEAVAQWWQISANKQRAADIHFLQLLPAGTELAKATHLLNEAPTQE